MIFEGLADRLQETFKKLRGHGKLTEDDVNGAMREVRMALLEADVNFKVVKDFVKRVKEQDSGNDEVPMHQKFVTDDSADVVFVSEFLEYRCVCSPTGIFEIDGIHQVDDYDDGIDGDEQDSAKNIGKLAIFVVQRNEINNRQQNVCV